MSSAFFPSPNNGIVRMWPSAADILDSREAISEQQAHVQFTIPRTRSCIGRLYATITVWEKGDEATGVYILAGTKRNHRRYEEVLLRTDTNDEVEIIKQAMGTYYAHWQDHPLTKHMKTGEPYNRAVSIMEQIYSGEVDANVETFELAMRQEEEKERVLETFPAVETDSTISSAKADNYRKEIHRMLWNNPPQLNQDFPKWPKLNKYRISWDQTNTPLTSLWVLRRTPENDIRYNQVFDSDDPPTTELDAIRRAGAIYYDHWYKSPEVRNRGPEPHRTIATAMFHGDIDLNAQTLLLAREELEENELRLRLSEARLVEEFKTLKWMTEIFEDDMCPEKKAPKEYENDIPVSVSGSENNNLLLAVTHTPGGETQNDPSSSASISANPVNENFRYIHRTPPLSYKYRFIKSNPENPANPLFVLPFTRENRERYNNIFQSTDPPQSEFEAIKRVGAIYYDAWYKCELARYLKYERTLAVMMVFNRSILTKENLRVAEEELRGNVFGFEEEVLGEEWKTLGWLWDEFEEMGEGGEGV